MDENLEIMREGRLGVIALDRPRAINALTLGMIRAISETLDAWEHDAGISAVLFEGRGERGFCAGGDVRATRELILAGKVDEANLFFEVEYRMNRRISTYSKPIVAIQDGIVMGGGIGVSGHARHRIATERSRFAMPEGAIGLFCDVGVNALVADRSEAAVLAFYLTGNSVGAADAIALNLSDQYVPSSKLGALRARLEEAAGAANPDRTLAALIAAHAGSPGSPDFCNNAEVVAEAFEKPTAAEIIAALALAGNDFAAEVAATASTRCPTSNEANVLAFRAAQRSGGIDTVLARDLRLAVYLAARPDFAEGVRAVLVDKDHAPNWQPAVAVADLEALVD